MSAGSKAGGTVRQPGSPARHGARPLLTVTGWAQAERGQLAPSHRDPHPFPPGWAGGGSSHAGGGTLPVLRPGLSAEPCPMRSQPGGTGPALARLQPRGLPVGRTGIGGRNGGAAAAFPGGGGGCRGGAAPFAFPRTEDGAAQSAPGLVRPAPARRLRAGRGRGGGEVSGAGGAGAGRSRG